MKLNKAIEIKIKYPKVDVICKSKHNTVFLKFEGKGLCGVSLGSYCILPLENWEIVKEAITWQEALKKCDDPIVSLSDDSDATINLRKGNFSEMTEFWNWKTLRDHGKWFIDYEK